VPFTQDFETFRFLLDEAQVRMAGPQTMIGDAIGLSIKLFENSETQNRVLILLTDGNDTGSKVPPVRAAGIAAQNGVTIHTIAMGDPETIGENKLDIDILKEISEVTGGEFSQAMNREELEQVYRKLDELEPLQFETLSYRPRRQLFFYPIALLLVLMIFYHLLAALSSLIHTRRKKKND
jgi:Ca-activated chloride channel family protein